MTDKEAMKLALEALELLTDTEQTFGALDYGDNAIAALEEALADPMRDVQRLGQEIEQAPCAKHCEATAFEIVIKNLRSEIESMKTPQRTWVGLTEQEHTDIAVECGCMSADWAFYGAAVERKVKERNQ